MASTKRKDASTADGRLQMKEKESSWKAVDKTILGICGALAAVFIILTAVMPKAADNVFSAILAFLTEDFGWLYLIVTSGFVVFLIWLVCSKYGRVKLGRDDEKPVYSTRLWLFMLFTAGMGIGLVFWGVAEPMTFYMDPPVGEPYSTDAAVLAMGHAFMHWGLHPWACFAIVGLPLAYFTFRKGKPALLSSCFEPLVGEKHSKGAFGKTINIIALLVSVLGIATSLGLGAAQINGGLYYVFGIPVNNQVFIVIVIVAMCCFVASSVSGIKRGIAMLSRTNMIIVGILIAFLLIVGNPVFVADMFTQSLGTYILNIIPWSFWADPFGDTEGWVGMWTIFYWGWWISWAPFVGAFIARISRGRTIREYIIASLFVPVLLCIIYMSVFGGTAINLDYNGVNNIALAVQEDVSYAMFALLQNFPLTTIFSLLAILLIAIFFITSADSSTFVCSMMTCHGIQDPPAGVKVFWGVLMAATAIVLQFAGGLTALQTACIAAAFPFMFICLGLLVSFMKELRKEKVFLAPIAIKGDEEKLLERTLVESASEITSEAATTLNSTSSTEAPQSG